jgi:hypothetical protein
MAYRTDQPLIKPKSQPSRTDERQELLNKAASASDPQLVQGYLARAREIPESKPDLPKDAATSVAAMIDVLAARGDATASRELASGYFGRARSLRQWLDHGQR